MCRATTHIFFGLPIRTWLLVPAADAWPKLVKTLPFFDLITLRILRGTFQASKRDNTGPSVAERIPVEVWDVVKHKSVDLALLDANDELMRDIDIDEWSRWGSGMRKLGKSLAGSALPPFWIDICSEAEPCYLDCKTCSASVFPALRDP
ncbi:proteophosphoglycan ppg4 [Rhodotorula toruloides]|uniref:Proteophosphoglycan ppg4 n=1 Tax=Rhodotorula toruloides TaxID=5286 RepID=A0A511KFZ7_RHOTO|nr:proteophosphoglycan ppg4 [Rhodotorula toruloides]